MGESWVTATQPRSPPLEPLLIRTVRWEVGCMTLNGYARRGEDVGESVSEISIGEDDAAQAARSTGGRRRGGWING